jgi:uncharacterized membrane protein
MLSDWVRILMAVFMLLYGYIWFRRIAKNIACELQKGVGPPKSEKGSEYQL